MTEKRASEQEVSADARRNFEEVRRLREQVLARQDLVIQQTQAEVRRHVERMRNVRSTIAGPELSVPKKPSTPSATPTPARPMAQKFDFDARRVDWEQRRRERAESRRAEMIRRNEPYQEYRRQLEEKRRLALEQQGAAASAERRSRR